ncbi:MAG: oxidoreductase [Candidatus Hydrogenedentota bacterium]
MSRNPWATSQPLRIIGTRVNRLDGPVKATGAAKYAYDKNLPDMLFGRVLWAPFGNAVVKSIDVSEAEGMAGVKSVIVEAQPGTEVLFAGTLIAVVAAEREEIATEAIHAIKVEYEVKPPQMDDNDPTKAEGRDQSDVKPDDATVEAALSGADVMVKGEYGCAVITHCCMEAHGQTVHFLGDRLESYPSTQNVTGYGGQLSDTSGLEASKISVDCQYMGGGFGSKFGPDQWDQISTRISKETGKPFKLFLERDQELMVAGMRPSGFAKVSVGVSKAGDIQVWDSVSWGSGGMGGGGALARLPYVFAIPNFRRVDKNVRTNRGSRRAWRAPNHPQQCFVTMAALEDAAAAIGMDALEFFKKNLPLTSMPEVYAEELDLAAEMIGYKEKAHLRGDKTPGPVKRGLGISIHTWGGGGHNCQSDVVINPDGSAAVNMSTQDLGSGTRTAIGIVVAETLGLPLDKVQVNIGNNKYPEGAASGGSTTIGGVSTAARDAANNALVKLLEKAAPALQCTVDDLIATDGKVLRRTDSAKWLPWEKACALLGQMPVTGRGGKPATDGTKLDDSGVGGVQIADVSVDTETGVVTVNEMAAVQDCGLIISMKTAESQVLGGLIMGITYALFEESVYDPATGRMLNADMEFYRLAGLPDIGTLKVKMMTGPKYDSRGVIGLGEPPVISPGAALSNAVANAIGVRVPTMPMTPDAVLNALAQGGVA